MVAITNAASEHMTFGVKSEIFFRLQCASFSEDLYI